MWPMYVEAVLSVAWAHAFAGLLAFWALCLAFAVPPPGASPFPNVWGMVVGTACLVQLLTGIRLDARYDPAVRKAFWLAPLYPLGYWAIMSAVTVRSTLPALLRRPPAVAVWSSAREDVRLAGAPLVPVPRIPAQARRDGELEPRPARPVGGHAEA